jgi:hypothetical protein
MIMIYHATDMRKTMFAEPKDVLAMFDNTVENDGFDFEFVADIMEDDLDVAYQLTNHIDQSWCENIQTNPELGRLAQHSEHRSTSVGDVFVAPDGIYVVANFGFEKIRTFNL